MAFKTHDKPQHHRSLTVVRRHRRFRERQIDVQNEQLMHRLMSADPSVDNRKLDNSYRYSRYLTSKMSRYGSTGYNADRHRRRPAGAAQPNGEEEEKSGYNDRLASTRRLPTAQVDSSEWGVAQSGGQGFSRGPLYRPSTSTSTSRSRSRSNIRRPARPPAPNSARSAHSHARSGYAGPAEGRTPQGSGEEPRGGRGGKRLVASGRGRRVEREVLQLFDGNVDISGRESHIRAFMLFRDGGLVGEGDSIQLKAYEPEVRRRWDAIYPCAAAAILSLA